MRPSSAPEVGGVGGGEGKKQCMFCFASVCFCVGLVCPVLQLECACVRGATLARSVSQVSVYCGYSPSPSITHIAVCVILMYPKYPVSVILPHIKYPLALPGRSRCASRTENRGREGRAWASSRASSSGNVPLQVQARSHKLKILTRSNASVLSRVSPFEAEALRSTIASSIRELCFSGIAVVAVLRTFPG